jgi:hypothetical protein
VTKQRRRDKESLAKSHRNKIIGTGSSEAHERSARTPLLAAVVVNLARRCLAKQSQPLGILDSVAVYVVIRSL